MDIAARWEDIGRILRVPLNYRDQLRMEGVQTSPETKLERTLIKWVESQCSPVTWSNLIGGLSSLQFNDVLYNVRQFVTSDHTLDKYLL